MKNEIISLPASVRNRLEQAETLVELGRPQEAQTILQQIGQELAKSHPELLVLLAATQMGKSRLSVEHFESNSETVETEHRFMGLRYGSEIRTTSTSITKRRSYSLV